MLGCVILARIPEWQIACADRPIIEFILIATLTAVKQIVQVVIPALELWLIMIHRQFAARVDFTDAAKLTGVIGAFSYTRPNRVGNGHAGCVPIRWVSWRRKTAISRRNFAFSEEIFRICWVTEIACARAASICASRSEEVIRPAGRNNISFSRVSCFAYQASNCFRSLAVSVKPRVTLSCN